VLPEPLEKAGSLRSDGQAFAARTALLEPTQTLIADPRQRKGSAAREGPSHVGPPRHRNYEEANQLTMRTAIEVFARSTPPIT
jgi:hypothetical protein